MVLGGVVWRCFCGGVGVLWAVLFVCLLLCLAFFLVLVLFLIWSGDVVSENLYFKVTATVFVIGISSNHSALLLLSRSKNKVVSGCKWATISLIILVTLMLIYIVWGEDLPEGLHRPLAVIVILDVLGTLSLPALNRFMGKHK